jgi:hypothetical protein
MRAGLTCSGKFFIIGLTNLFRTVKDFFAGLGQNDPSKGDFMNNELHLGALIGQKRRLGDVRWQGRPSNCGLRHLGEKARRLGGTVIGRNVATPMLPPAPPGITTRDPLSSVVYRFNDHAAMIQFILEA